LFINIVIFSESVSKFVSYVAGMKFDEVPDYAKVRAIFTAGLKACGGRLDGPFDFSVAEEAENAAPPNTPQNGRSPQNWTNSVRAIENGQWTAFSWDCDTRHYCHQPRKVRLGWIQTPNFGEGHVVRFGEEKFECHK